jgi:hypothetical protein
MSLNRDNPLLMNGEFQSFVLAERILSQLSACRVSREFFHGRSCSQHKEYDSIDVICTKQVSY